MIIDFHTHPFITKEQNSCFYENTVKDPEDFARLMHRAGIDVWCGSVIEKGTSLDTVKVLNDTALKLKEFYGEKYIPGIHIHPNFVGESIEMLEYYAQKGVRLAGELVPYYHGWEHYYDEGLHSIYEKINTLNMVVSLHTQSEESMEQAIKTFKDIIFVCAHPRDRVDLENHISRLKKYDNCYLDLSGTGLFRFGMLKKLVNEVGSEKILFGTDFPICNPEMYVRAVDFEEISSKDKDNIYFKNAQRVLGI